MYPNVPLRTSNQSKLLRQQLPFPLIGFGLCSLAGDENHKRRAPLRRRELMKKYNAFHDKLYLRTHGRYSLRTGASDLDNLTDDLFISSSSL